MGSQDAFLGELNVAALERSLHEIVQRHEALRTTFAPRENEPVQVIAPTLPDILSFVDLTELAEDKSDVRAQQLAREEAQRLLTWHVLPLLEGLLFLCAGIGFLIDYPLALLGSACAVLLCLAIGLRNVGAHHLAHFASRIEQQVQRQSTGGERTLLVATVWPKTALFRFWPGIYAQRP